MSLSGPSSRPGRRGIAARRQMHAVDAGELGKRRLAMHHQTRAVAAHDRQQRARQQNLLVFRQILLAQAHPAATGRQRRGNDFGKRPARLPAVGDEKERRTGRLHAGTEH